MNQKSQLSQKAQNPLSRNEMEKFKLFFAFYPAVLDLITWLEYPDYKTKTVETLDCTILKSCYCFDLNQDSAYMCLYHAATSILFQCNPYDNRVFRKHINLCFVRLEQIDWNGCSDKDYQIQLDTERN